MCGWMVRVCGWMVRVCRLMVRVGGWMVRVCVCGGWMGKNMCSSLALHSITVGR